MQSDIDAQLTNFFEEAPPREFATVFHTSSLRVVHFTIRWVRGFSDAEQASANSARSGFD